MENHGKSSIYGWFSQISHSKFGFSSCSGVHLWTKRWDFAQSATECATSEAHLRSCQDWWKLLWVSWSHPVKIFQGRNCCDSLFDMAASSRFWWSPSTLWGIQATKKGPRSADQQWCGVLPSMDRPREGTSFLSSKVATKRQIPCILTCHSRYSLCPNCFYIWQNGTIGCNILFRFRRTHCSCPS